jgi:hypothetical protein
MKRAGTINIAPAPPAAADAGAKLQAQLANPRALLTASGWCQLLAGSVPATTSIEWHMRLHNSVTARSVPPARFASGIRIDPRAQRWPELNEKSVLWFAAGDMSAWLESLLGVAAAGAMTTAAGDEADPTPLSSAEVANVFAGLRGWGEARWRHELGSPEGWLAEAEVNAKERARGQPRKWNPVAIGASLVAREKVSVNSVRARFQTRPTVISWLRAWGKCEAVAFPGKK